MSNRAFIASASAAGSSGAGALLQRVILLLVWLSLAGPAMAQTAQPLTVGFPSADGRTKLVGYLFAPAGRPKQAPAVVLMHGRAGIYSPRAKGNYAAMTIDKGIRGAAEFWAQQGYWALIVDSYGPRGQPAGLPAIGDGDKTPAIGDTTVRPLDAYGALRYLRASPRVRADRIALEGWGGGGSAVLAAMNSRFLPVVETPAAHGFHIALAVDPVCRPAPGGEDYLPYAPVHVFSPRHAVESELTPCQKLAAASRAAGGDLLVTGVEPLREADHRAGERPEPSSGAATGEMRRQAAAVLAAALSR